VTVEANDASEQYSISGVGPYAFSFRIFDETDLTVVALSSNVPAEVVPLTYLTHYTVAGANELDGGTITLTADAASDYNLYTLDVRSNTPNTQPTSIRNQGRFLPEIHEDAFDHLERQIQDLNRRMNLTVRFPDSMAPDGEMSPIQSWASKYLAVSSQGRLEAVQLTDSGAISQSVIGALLYPRTAAEIAAGVTPTNYAYPPGDCRRYGATLSSADNSTAINAAIAVSAAGGAPARIPAGTWFGQPTMLAGSKLIGAGRDVTTLKIPAGASGNLITGSGVDNVEISGLELNCDGAAAGSGTAASFSNCDYLQLSALRSQSAPGPGLVMSGCDYFYMRDIHVDDAGASVSAEWGMQIDSCDNGQGSNLLGTNCGNRFVMVRTSDNCNFFGITCRNNGGTAFWFQGCNYCHMVGGSDQGSVGDSWVIENDSIGCSISDVSCVDCGGHGASIASDTGGPVDCHIDNVYSSGQGEAMAAISDQGTAHPAVNCSITNVRGRNPGRVVQMEAFGISGGIGCLIEGSISDDTYGMTHAVKEVNGGGTASNNRFHIRSWLEGSSGYFALVASTSTIKHDQLDDRLERKGNTDFSWDPGANGQIIIYDQATLTADRTVTLANGWPQQRVKVSRSAAGAFNLVIQNAAASTLDTLAAGTWAEFVFDGTNWNLLASGSI
jgi:hypothetical protein